MLLQKTKREIILIAYIVLSISMSMSTICHAYAGNPLSGEGNGDHVKLFWMPDYWPENLRGFQVLRCELTRSAECHWQPLHDEVILPACTQEKDLSGYMLDEEDRKRLEDKRRMLFAGEGAVQLQIISYEDYRNAAAEEGFLNSMAMFFGFDYDIALLHGFAFIDRAVKPGKQYRYAILFHYDGGEDSINGTYEWTYGQNDRVSLELLDSRSEIFMRTRVRLEWQFSSEEYLHNRLLTGFNLYRSRNGQDFQKINSTRLQASAHEDKVRIVHVEAFDEEHDLVFKLVPVSLFNTEGKSYSLSFDPMLYSEDLQAPQPVEKEGYSAEKGIELEWDFPDANKKHIRGFRILRTLDIFEDFEDVSGLLTVDCQSYHDRLLPVSEKGYYYYRVLIELSDGRTKQSSNLRIYAPKIVRAPGQAKVSRIENEAGHFVRIEWEHVQTDRQGYYVYRLRNGREIGISGAHPLQNNVFDYRIPSSGGIAYNFIVKAVDANGVESAFPEQVSILVPSDHIYPVQFTSLELNDMRVTMEWDYPHVPDDMLGFRIYKDGVLWMDEGELKSDTRNVAKELLPGTYNLSITSFYTDDRESRRLPARQLVVPAENE